MSSPDRELIGLPSGNSNLKSPLICEACSNILILSPILSHVCNLLGLSDSTYSELPTK